MRIASYNVNSLRARLPVVLQWLTENKPDVLCVQETKVQDIDFPAKSFDELGYNYAYKGEKSYNGVAVFSPHEIKNIRYGFDDEPKDQARLIKAEINGITIINSYIPQGYLPETEKFRYKLAWFGRLRNFFEEKFKQNQAIIWLGDFNIAPEPIDVYDSESLYGHVCFHPQVHQALKEVMEWGFVDVFRLHCKDPGQYTFWDYRLRNSFRHNLGWRLDHIMATAPLAEKCKSCYIDTKPRIAKRPSDHTVIAAEFDWSAST